MVVQQHVLNWLYSVLTSEYRDVNRTYNDVAQALSRYATLSPRTDVHTFPNGSSALLLHLSGTIPVLFRGTTYRFPISLWVPHAYPREPPLVYVTPTETMMVRPGQHVDPQGQVYHPYLVGWASFWDKSNIVDFLAILQDVFAKEPPVVARAQAQPPPAAAQARPAHHTPTPPPVPPLPQELSARPPSSVHSTPAPSGQPQPPPPPPKPYQQQPPRPDGAPPLPDPSSGGGQPYRAGVHSPLYAQSTQNNRLSRYDSAPPLPPQVQEAPSQPAQQQAYSPVAPHSRQSFYQATTAVQNSYHSGTPQTPISPAESHRVSSFPVEAHAHHQQQHPPQQASSQQLPPPQQQGGYHPQWQTAPPQQPRQKAPPPPDLMDEPLTLSIPPPSTVRAPPIPPNPEKDALLHQLASTLYQMRAQVREQNDSRLHGLQAQRTAMLNAMSTMQSEIGSLTQLSNLLQNNTTILRDTVRRADEVVQRSATLPAPDIDQLLVAPTVVANQLYELVAEERALADAIFVLGRSVERGRVAPAVFAKTTRSLAREWYLKKALVRKIGRGMGLAV